MRRKEIVRFIILYFAMLGLFSLLVGDFQTERIYIVQMGRFPYDKVSVFSICAFVSFYFPVFYILYNRVIIIFDLYDLVYVRNSMNTLHKKYMLLDIAKINIVCSFVQGMVMYMWSGSANSLRMAFISVILNFLSYNMSALLIGVLCAFKVKKNVIFSLGIMCLILFPFLTNMQLGELMCLLLPVGTLQLNTVPFTVVGKMIMLGLLYVVFTRKYNRYQSIGAR